jgi:hypothetical protein
VHGHDLHVAVVMAAIDILEFDAQIREVNLPVEAGQV